MILKPDDCYNLLHGEQFIFSICCKSVHINLEFGKLQHVIKIV
jgi:hypothetical protein